MTESVARAAAGDSFVLVGYSSGGLLARAVAERLERDGAGPSGVVLLDTYEHEPAEAEQAFAVAIGEMIKRDHEYVAIDDAHLVAMGAYIRMFREWTPTPIAAPSVVLRASEPLFDDDGGRLADAVVEVAGDHFSILEEHAEATARATEAWLAQTLAGVGAAT